MPDYGLHVAAGVVALITVGFQSFEILEWAQAKWPAVKAKWTEFFAPVKAVEQDSQGDQQPPVIYLSMDSVC